MNMRLASINCTVATVESSRPKKYFCRKEQKKKKEENEVPGIDPKCLACRSRPVSCYCYCCSTNTNTNLLRTTATYQLPPINGIHVILWSEQENK